MKIKAIKMTSTHCKGCVYELPESEAVVLIENKLAIEIKEPNTYKQKTKK